MTRAAQVELSAVSGEDLDRVRERHPGWSIWPSDEGRLWATRMTATFPLPMPDGYMRTVDADDTDGLERQIAVQESIACTRARRPPAGDSG